MAIRWIVCGVAELRPSVTVWVSRPLGAGRAGWLVWLAIWSWYMQDLTGKQDRSDALREEMLRTRMITVILIADTTNPFDHVYIEIPNRLPP